MEHTHAEHQSGGGTKEIWKVTIILSVLTIIELVLGFLMIGIPLEREGLRLLIKGVIVILMMAKAFYIVAYFMHLKHEIRNLIMTIVVPLALFIWFIIAKKSTSRKVVSINRLLSILFDHIPSPAAMVF